MVEIKKTMIIFILAALMTIVMLAKLLYEEYSPDSRILRIISKKISSRALVDEREMIASLSKEAEVPLEFAKLFLSSLASSIGVEIGRLRLSDYWDQDLSAHISELPSRLRIKVKSPQEYTDARNFGEFVCWEWRSECSPEIMDSPELEAIAKDPHVTVTELCRKLYSLERSVKNAPPDHRKS